MAMAQELDAFGRARHAARDKKDNQVSEEAFDHHGIGESSYKCN